jgi:hypothetical protein
MESNQGGALSSVSALEFHRSNLDKTPYELGGICIFARAAAAVINSGDLVFASATGFNKSATATNYVGFKGVAVGGKLTNGDIVYGTGKALTTGVAGEQLIVQITGFAMVVADGTITPGTHFTVIPATVSGRVIAGTTAGQVVGNTVDGNAGVQGGDIRIYLSPR